MLKKKTKKAGVGGGGGVAYQEIDPETDIEGDIRFLQLASLAPRVSIMFLR